MKIKKVNDGLYIQMKLMHLKYQLNGIPGYIICKIKFRTKHTLEKYEWQKPHQPNLTGTDKAYYPNKDINEIGKKYKSWKE